jgi:transposase
MPLLSAYEVYQTHLRGPAAVIRLFEQTFGTLALYGPPEPDFQQRTIEAQSAEIDLLQARLLRLEAEVTRLRYHNRQLVSQIAQTQGVPIKDSHNSHRPPSTDRLKRTRSLRQPSGRRPGGQVGHQGETRRLVPHPDQLWRHSPATCHHCHSSLASAPAVSTERRQVWDLPPVKLQVVEHQAEVRWCVHCGRQTKGEFPDEVRSRVQYGQRVRAWAVYLVSYQLLPYRRAAELLSDLCGCRLSGATIKRGIDECADKLSATAAQIKRALKRARVIHVDETGLRVSGRGQYVHVASTGTLTSYQCDPQRGKGAVERVGVLLGYRGTCVHDAHTAYTAFTTCRHALCGAHLLRELNYFAEASEEHKQWAVPIKELLLEMKRAVEEERAAGARQMAAQRVRRFGERFDELVKVGRKMVSKEPSRADPENVEARDEARDAVIKREARSFVGRLERRRAEVLRFVEDFEVPFDNNQAERDLRMIKLQQKVSGCFRTEEGAERFCRIRSYLSTMRKRGQNVLKVIEGAVEGCPLPLTC